MPKSATYAATKAFVLSFSEALHQELKGTGVTVTAVCPGPVRTEFVDAAGHRAAPRSTPGFIWMSAEDLAEDAVKAAEAGKRAVVPGTAQLRGHRSSAATRRASSRCRSPGGFGAGSSRRTRCSLNGVELRWREHGAGPPLLLPARDARPAARSGSRWSTASGAGRAHDRASTAAAGEPPARPEQYAATTVEEQAEDAAALLAELDAGPAVACGAGLGAVAALDLLLRHRDLVGRRS